MKNLLLSSVLLASAALVQAASAPPAPGPVAAVPEPEPLDVYSIELIIFDNRDQGQEETWPEDPEQPDRSLAIGALTQAYLREPLPADPLLSGTQPGEGSTTITTPPTEPGPAAAALVTEPTPPPPRTRPTLPPVLQDEPVAIPEDMVLLDAEAQEMGPVAYTLRRAGHAVLLHLAWRQPVADRESPTWLWVDSPRLYGLVRMTRGRFLHLDTDLVLETENPWQPYRVRLHRRMRSDELHYVDHPKLGLVVKALRYEVPEEPPEPAVDAETNGDPATVPAAGPQPASMAEDTAPDTGAAQADPPAQPAPR